MTQLANRLDLITRYLSPYHILSLDNDVYIEESSFSRNIKLNINKLKFR